MEVEERREEEKCQAEDEATEEEEEEPAKGEATAEEETATAAGPAPATMEREEGVAAGARGAPRVGGRRPQERRGNGRKRTSRGWRGG